MFLDHRPLWSMLGAISRVKVSSTCFVIPLSLQRRWRCRVQKSPVLICPTPLRMGATQLFAYGIDPSKHQLLRADCLKWLDSDSQTFDVIFLDPPTFSNSKNGVSVDIQRDHPELIRKAMAKLNPQGKLIFSNNFRKFKMDQLISRQFNCENITFRPDMDFQRNRRP